MTKSARPAPIHHLSLQVHEIAQLFNSMDPTPFLNKDLDPEAESFIETWASGFAPGSRFHWWPLQRQIRLYQKLGSAHVQVTQGK